MADSWDDAALIDAFNASIRKYQEMHSRKKKQADKLENKNLASNEEHLEAHEPASIEEESNHCEEANATHQELPAESFGIENQPYNEQYTQSSQQENSYWSGVDPSNPHMPYQYPQPWGYQPPYICPPLVCAPYPFYPGFQGTHCCNTSHTCPCASQNASLRSSAPAANFELLKAAVRTALSQLPDKVIGEDKLNGSNGEVLLAWFNAGFQTASHLHQANKTSESKKEAFRKYLESSGVLDSLTKVLVALYEENDKPPLAVDFIQHNLGGFTNEEYNKLKAEKDELQTKYDELVKTHEELSKKFEELQLQLPPDDQSPAGAPPPA